MADREYWRGFRCGFVVAATMLWLSSAVVGAEIAGESQVPVYRLARFEITGTAATAQSVWAVRPQGCDIQQSGNKLTLTGKPGAYELEATVVDFDARTLERISKLFTIGEPVPPGPGPNPGPEPEPEPLTGLAKTVYELAAKANEPIVAKALAENYSSVQAQIAAGAYNGDVKTEKTKIVAWLYSVNHKLVAESAAWDALFTKLDEIFIAADKAGELDTVKAIAAKFAEIETGLRRAAK